MGDKRLRYADYSKDIDHLIELPDVYDGWSIAVLKDGTRVNRWANADDTGPREGYERRYTLTQQALDYQWDRDPRPPE